MTNRCRILLPFLLFLWLSSSDAFAQIHPHFGVEVGVPLTDTLSSTSFSSSSSLSMSADRYNSDTKRFLVGPVFRVDLVRGLGLEFDALYQRVDYDHFTLTSSSSFVSQSFEQTKGDRWQFPLLVQYSFPFARTRPFVEAGPAISRITNVSGQISAKTIAPGTPPSISSSTYPNTGSSGTQAGFTAGGGIDFPFGRFHLRPEIRYSHWFAAAGPTTVGVLVSTGFIVGSAIPSTFRAKQNEASFLLGLSF